MRLAGRIGRGEETLAVVGLGYVGMPIAVEFAKKGVRVLGYDPESVRLIVPAH